MWAEDILSGEISNSNARRVISDTNAFSVSDVLIKTYFVESNDMAIHEVYTGLAIFCFVAANCYCRGKP